MKTHFQFLIFALAFIPQTFTSQNCSQWIRSAPGDLTPSATNGDIEIDASENLYITGTNNYFLAKYDANGNLVWNKTKTGLTAADVVLTGSNELFTTATGALLSKFDLSGNELFPTINIANTEPTGIVSDANNNVYITGVVSGPAVFGTATYTDGVFVVKFNNTGNLVWSENIVNSVNTNSFAITYPKMDIHGNNLFIAANLFNSGVQTISSGTVSSVVNVSAIKWVCTKMDVNGNTIWIKFPTNPPNTGTAGANELNMMDLIVDNANNIWVTTMFGSGTGPLLKYDTSAALLTHHGFVNTRIKKDNSGIVAVKIDASSQNRSTIFRFGTNPASFESLYSSMIWNNFLIGVSPNGRFYTAYNSTSPDTSFIDMNFISNVFPGNIVIAKYTANYRMLPTYAPSYTLECGTGPLALSYEPNFIIQYNFSGFSWSPASGLSATNIHNPVANPSVTTQYVVTMPGSCTASVNINVTNASAFTYTSSSQTVTFSIVNNTACSSFLWDFGNGNTSSLNPNPIVTYANAGTYSPCLKCNNQSNQCVKCLNITVPSNGSGGIGILENTKSNFLKVYPNPGHGKFYCDLVDDKKGYSIQILDILGKTILQQMPLSNGTTGIDLSNQSTGLYFIQLSYEGTLIESMKVMIE
jgi:hypothetical protein